MKPIYRNSIAIGLAGIIVIIGLYFLSAYLAGQEWQEHYRTSPGSGVLMVGVYSWILFFLDVLLAFAAIGAVSAWASRRHITSIRGTILASALAALVPIVPATVLALFLSAIAIYNMPEHYGSGFFTNLFPVLLFFLIYASVGLMLSIVGGVVYRMLVKGLSYVKKG